MSTYLACADRERVNPLDPKNRDTMGRPTDLRVFSRQDTVFLMWDLIKLDDLSGFRIYRANESLADHIPHDVVSPDQNHFEDVNVEFSTSYSYSITAFGPTFESPPSDTVSIVPGPTFTWVANTRGQQLIKLTHDSRHRILSTSGFLPIQDLEVDRNTGQLWVLETFAGAFGSAIRVLRNGETLSPRTNLVAPVDGELDERDGSIWIADESGLVVKLNSAGERLFTISSLGLPISVSVDQRNGDCWVADKNLNRLVRVSRDGGNIDIQSLSFAAIQSVAVNSNTGMIWVADSSRVILLADAGSQALVPAFKWASKVVCNNVTGEAWVVDVAASSVRKFSPVGEAVFQVAEFSEPRDLAVNLFDHSCLVADTGNDRLVRISAEGNAVEVFGDVTDPSAVAVQNPPLRN